MDTSAFRGEKEVNVRIIPKWIWTEWVQVCTQLKKYPDAVNNIRIVTDNERLKRDRKSTRLNSSHTDSSRMPSSA